MTTTVTKNWSRRSIDELSENNFSIDPETISIADKILQDVYNNGESAARRTAETLGDIDAGTALILKRADMQESLESISDSKRSLLERTAGRIKRFATAQRETLGDCQLEIPGGHVGHRWLPLESAGCYAPGGRYPLPSSVLMTAISARVAGVKNVWVASPRPSPETIAAAEIAGADGILCIGGVQAIGVFAYGLKQVMPKVDVIVGPGNRFVTAAKAIVSRLTRIDMLAGPSEIVVVASSDADERLVAADLLAQAEHDTDARPILITDVESFAFAVQRELSSQIESLSTSDVANTALRNGGFVVVDSVDEAIACCSKIAPEHLSLQGNKFTSRADKFTCGSALFVGDVAAEVLGDYGAGPNHVLPTGGGARSQSGLSVACFMRMQTHLQIDNKIAAQPLVEDAIDLARIEGLEAHARSAKARLL